jgi:hypothetical protein
MALEIIRADWKAKSRITSRSCIVVFYRKSRQTKLATQICISEVPAFYAYRRLLISREVLVLAARPTTLPLTK